MKYAAEMCLGVMIYIPSFMQIGSGIQKLITGVTGERMVDLIRKLLDFQNKRSRLKIEQITWNIRYDRQFVAHVSHQRFYGFLRTRTP
jgi:hypothetical protein